MKAIDRIFSYRDERFPMGADCACRIRIWQLKDGRRVVIATELEPSPGASVTNTCERWADGVCREYLLDPLKTIFVEHYDRRDGKVDPDFAPETFDFITFTWSDPRTSKEPAYAEKPQWKHGTKAQVEMLIEDSLDI